MGGGMDTNIYYCLPPAGGRIRSQGTKMRHLRRRTREAQRYGFISINDMYNNDVGKGGAQGCEAY
jgi:hypothetical protein